MKLYTVIRYVFRGELITPNYSEQRLKEVTIAAIRQMIGAWAVPIVRQSVNNKFVSPYLVVDLAALGFTRPGEEFTDLGKHFSFQDLDTAVATAVTYDQQRRDNDTSLDKVAQIMPRMAILPKRRKP